MRGDLRIHSQREPYQRAGLVWSTREPVLVSIADLNGDRLIRLANDPVLRIEAEDQAGKWRPLPKLPGDVTVEQAQMMIDTIAAEIPAIDDPAPAFTVADALAERDALSARLGEAEAQILALQASLDEAIAARAQSAEAVDALQADKITLSRDLAAARKHGGTKSPKAVTIGKRDQASGDPASPPSEG